MNDILRAAGTEELPKEAPQSPLVAEVVRPLLAAAEAECGQVLSRISLDEMVNRAVTAGAAPRRDEHHAA